MPDKGASGMEYGTLSSRQSARTRLDNHYRRYRKKPRRITVLDRLPWWVWLLSAVCLVNIAFATIYFETFWMGAKSVKRGVLVPQRQSWRYRTRPNLLDIIEKLNQTTTATLNIIDNEIIIGEEENITEVYLTKKELVTMPIIKDNKLNVTLVPHIVDPLSTRLINVAQGQININDTVISGVNTSAHAITNNDTFTSGVNTSAHTITNNDSFTSGGNTSAHTITTNDTFTSEGNTSAHTLVNNNDTFTSGGNTSAHTITNKEVSNAQGNNTNITEAGNILIRANSTGQITVTNHTDETNPNTTGQIIGPSLERTTRTSIFTGPVHDCSEGKMKGFTKSGIYEISPDGGPAFNVWCEMLLDGGGWTVIQRQRWGNMSFNNSWSDYRSGFGYVEWDHWLGSDYINRLTEDRHQQLLVQVTTTDGQHRLAKYRYFSISNNTFNYRINISHFDAIQSNAEDAMTSSLDVPNNDQAFTTHDNNDPTIGACDGAWWFPAGCGLSNLNGNLHQNASERIRWGSLDMALTGSTMMIKTRPMNASSS